MKRKLNTILLIDDEVANNYYHQMIIKEADPTQNIAVAQTGLEALDYLASKENGKHPKPELLFLDINMPKMDGWGFLEAHRKLPAAQKHHATVIIMLTTSLSPFDMERAEGIPEIQAFKSKPITTEMLDEIFQNFF